MSELNRFSPILHIPKYSRILASALQTPLLIYLAIMGNAFMIGIGEVFFRYESPINDAVTSRWDAMWWALATVSTVGYGDIVPATPQGRLCGFALIIVGITFFLSYMAVLVSVINSQVAEETTHIVASKSDLSEILRRLENIESRLKEK